MSIAETDIESAALIMLGAAPINSPNTTSNMAQAAQALYPIERDNLLRANRWPWALKFATINELATAPIPLDVIPNQHGPGFVIYTLAFQLPTDCVRVSRFSPQEAHWRIVGNQVYTDAIPVPPVSTVFATQPPGPDGSDNLPGPIISPSAAPPIGIEYVSRVTDPNEFDSAFVELLATKLAMELAFAVSGLESQQDRMERRFKEKFADAMYLANAENWPDQLYDTKVVDVRYGYSGISITG